MSASVTDDALLGGKVAYRQPARGYRVALEAPLLAWFAVAGRKRAFAHAVDLGAGPGAIGLMLAVTGWAARVTAVELDAMHARLASENAERNAVADRFTTLEADAARACTQPTDLVIANPPYFDPDTGAVAPDARRARARALTPDTLDAFVRASRRALGRNGRVVIGFPSSRLLELLASLERSGLHAKRARFVHPRPNREAQVVFLEAKPARAGGLVIEPAIFVRQATGEAYTPEAQDALQGRWPSPTAKPRC